MTAVTVYELVCDAAGCNRRYGCGDVESGPTRAAAWAAGWRWTAPRESGELVHDWCPDHARHLYAMGY